MANSDDALAVALAYHNAWSTGEYEKAIRLLSRDLKVEVPVNSYPTVKSFAEALVGFGGLVRRVRLLSRLGGVDEATLVYDMDVDKLGTMRVAEHFTIAMNKIVRLRQIHDTAALRAAGLVKDI